MIFRPSFVFGRDEGALPTFVRPGALSPVVPVIGTGSQRSQPIWVDDVAAYVAARHRPPEAANRTFDLGGPDRVNWDELYLRIARGDRQAAAARPRPGAASRASARSSPSGSPARRSRPTR